MIVPPLIFNPVKKPAGAFGASTAELIHTLSGISW